MVGEQPGDVEDRRGEPFVGPAGRLLDQALEQAGLDRKSIYLTNAVKHFRFTERGKRRLHRSPDAGHITACRPWLSAELEATQPDLIVALGAVAGRALLGPSFRVTKQRGVLLPGPGAQLLATIHPSAVLRAEDRDAAFAGLVADLEVAAAAVR
jgi:DNA polymerase